MIKIHYPESPRLLELKELKRGKYYYVMSNPEDGGSRYFTDRVFYVTSEDDPDRDERRFAGPIVSGILFSQGSEGLHAIDLHVQRGDIDTFLCGASYQEVAGDPKIDITFD